MLGEWVDIENLSKVSVMGMSLGSVVASSFAVQRPELVDRMILMGVMQKTRKSWRMLLEESLHLMNEQRMDEFGQGGDFVSGQSCQNRPNPYVTDSKTFILQTDGRIYRNRARSL